MDRKLKKAAEEGDVMFLAARIVRIGRTKEEDLQVGILRIERSDRADEEANQYGSSEDRYLLNTTQEDKNNILHLAAKAGRDLFAAVALQFLPVLSNQVNSQGDTPLLVAYKFGHLNVVETIKKPKLRFQIQCDMATATSTLIEINLSGSSQQGDVEEEPVGLSLVLGTIHDQLAIAVENGTNSRGMDPKLYKAAKEGDVKPLSRKNSGIYVRHVPEKLAEYIQDGKFCKRTQHGNNNVLHIAARAGRDTFVAEALNLFPFLSDQENSQGDTPLLVAARFGHVKVVKKLAEELRIQEENGREMEGVQVEEFRIQDENGREMEGVQVDNHSGVPIPREPHPRQLKNLKHDTTALHEALRNGHESVAQYLFESYPDMATLVNGAKESPLFLAAESNCELVMKDILHSEQPYSTEGPQGLNVLHAARHCHGTIVRELIKQKPDLMRKLDNHGKAAIHYAVEADYEVFLHLMLEADASIALFPDADGYTPLLRAASRGLFKTFRYILKRCPESMEACNDKGQHALHLAPPSFWGVLKIQTMIPEIMELLNVSDDEGNTPLHLAVKENHYQKVFALSAFPGINLGAANKEGRTALDLCESDWKQYNSIKSAMWNILISNGAPRGRCPNEHKVPFGYRVGWLDEGADLKPFNKTILLVATLITTLTFAAAFTTPGGFEDKGADEGTAVLVKKAALQVFIVSDTVAMCCSLAVVFSLSEAMICEKDAAFIASVDSWKLLRVALVATLVAFMSGIFAVISSKALWLAISVCVVCSLACIRIDPFGFTRSFLLRFVINMLLRSTNIQRWLREMDQLAS